MEEGWDDFDGGGGASGNARLPTHAHTHETGVRGEQPGFRLPDPAKPLLPGAAPNRVARFGARRAQPDQIAVKRGLAGWEDGNFA